VTNRPASDARPSSLHPRLTVALANATDRARLAAVIASDLGTIHMGGVPSLLRSDDLWEAAGRFADERASARRELREGLDAVAARTRRAGDTARHQHEHLLGRRRTLLDGAAWATDLVAELDLHVGAVDAARDALDGRRADQRGAQQVLGRVLEQRHVATAAIEDADRELGDMASTGMDERGLRRELEAASRAVRDAHEIHDAARARLEELQIEASGLVIRREATDPSGTTRRSGAAEVAAVQAVADALADLHSVTIDGEVDPEAVALAEAWSDLTEDLRQLGGPVEGPTDDDLLQARHRADAASARRAELDGVKAASALHEDQRAALDAAHAAVLAAEEQAARRRRRGAARELEQARAAERALLDQHGFGGYLDVVLTGGRAAVDPSRTAVEREHFEAVLALEALERAGQVSPDLAHVLAERTRLLGHVSDLLGVDPGSAVLPLLQAHRPRSRARQAPLIAALTAVDVHPVGVSLEEAALCFLAANPMPEADVEAAASVAGVGDRQIERAAVDARTAALEGELMNAQAEVDRSAEALQMAERSVDAFESELATRAGEDLARMQRFAAAEQLRAQIDAVAATLRRAEEDARHSIEVAEEAVGAASHRFDQAANEVDELARRARQLAEELPIEERPVGDPLQTLPLLADGLRTQADVLQPDIDRAAAVNASASIQLEEELAASRLASHGDDGPQAEDLVSALQQLLEAEPVDVPVVLDEAFAGVDGETRGDLLEVLRSSAAPRPLVLLTEDAEVLGWAIELSIEEGTAIPADALLARIRRANQGLDVSPATSDPTLQSVDITTPATDPESAPTARRWAGQR